MRKLPLLLIVLFLAACQTKPSYLQEGHLAGQNEQMSWWRDAKLGLYIHWGLFSLPAGQWGASLDHGDRIRETARIPQEEYRQLAKQFNPQNFNPREWVLRASQAGIKYIIVTAKHYDGFCLWDSKHTDFDIMSSPYGADMLKQLAQACHEEDMRLGLKYSIMDWNHPDYLPHLHWEESHPEQTPGFEDYVTYVKLQLKELLTDYGTIDILWFDGGWEGMWDMDHGKDLYHYVKSFQPDILVNNRISMIREEAAGVWSPGEFSGDFVTPSQEIPDQIVTAYDWETSLTMNTSWSYNRLDKNYKTPEELLENLADIASKGGNMLLNTGPMASGDFTPESLTILRNVGEWLKRNGESIFGTRPGPIGQPDWGRCTMKPMAESSRLYLHILDWPEDGILHVPRMANEVIRIFLLDDPDQPELPWTADSQIHIDLSGKQPARSHRVVVLDVIGQPTIPSGSEDQVHSDALSIRLE